MNGAALHVVVDELVLEGVDVDDPDVAAALARTLGPVLAEHRAQAATSPVVGAVVAQVGREVVES